MELTREGSLAGRERRGRRQLPAWLRPSDDGASTGASPFLVTAPPAPPPPPIVLQSSVMSSGPSRAGRPAEGRDAAPRRRRGESESRAREDGDASLQGSVSSSRSARDVFKRDGAKQAQPLQEPPLASAPWGSSSYVISAPDQATGGARRRKKRTWEIDSDARKRAESKKASTSSHVRRREPASAAPGTTMAAGAQDEQLAVASTRRRVTASATVVRSDGNASEGSTESAGRQVTKPVVGPPDPSGCVNVQQRVPPDDAVSDSLGELLQDGFPRVVDQPLIQLSMPSTSAPAAIVSSLPRSDSTPSAGEIDNIAVAADDQIVSGPVASSIANDADPCRTMSVLTTSGCRRDVMLAPVDAAAPAQALVPATRALPRADDVSASAVDDGARAMAVTVPEPALIAPAPWLSLTPATTAAATANYHPFPDLDALLNDGDTSRRQSTVDACSPDGGVDHALPEDDADSSEGESTAVDTANPGKSSPEPEPPRDVPPGPLSSLLASMTLLGSVLSEHSAEAPNAQMDCRVQLPPDGAPPVLASPPPRPRTYVFLDQYPEFKTIFTGCLASSNARNIAGGGLSGSVGRSDAAADAAMSSDQAARHVLGALASWDAFQRLDPVEQLRLAREHSVATAAADAEVQRGDDDDAVGAASTDDVTAAAPSEADDSSDFAPTTVVQDARPDLPLRFFRVMTGRGEVASIVRRALAGQPDWQELPAGIGTTPIWSLLWSWGKAPVNRNLLLRWQKVRQE